MKKYIINGQKLLSGKIKISGSKNVATKAVIAACLTDEQVILENVPQISDIDALLEIIEAIGGEVTFEKSKVIIKVATIKNNFLSLEEGSRVRTTSMFLAPLLLRSGKAVVPNPEGCRIGARPIERHIDGLVKMGAEISYESNDGYYHASANGLSGCTYRFEKNTHTGTETMIMAATLAKGTTILENAAQEHEIDDLISLLSKMGAKIRRENGRRIVIEGVSKLHGATHTIVSDSNEIVTFAVLSILTGGKIMLANANLDNVTEFLSELDKVGGLYDQKNGLIRFYRGKMLRASDIMTLPEPGFKTDWQGPWAILMTQAQGVSSIHETIYENRFGYVTELEKMGAKFDFLDPKIENPQSVYNFNYDSSHKYQQAVRIYGNQSLHNAVLTVPDLRAGATLVIASLIAKGESVISGIEHLERGYENFSNRLFSLGADIKEVEEEY